MDNNQQNNYYDIPEVQEKATFGVFTKVFLWMIYGVALTAIFAYAVGNVAFLAAIALSPAFIIIACISQIVISFAISRQALVKMNKASTVACFSLYSILNGFIFGIIFLAIDMETLAISLGMSVALFVVMAAFGIIFKDKVVKLRSFAYVGLFTLLILSVVSLILWRNDTIYAVVSILGLAVFLILTLVDMGWIKRMVESSSNPDSVAVYGAFHLYLNFINIFIYVLRIVMRNRR